MEIKIYSINEGLARTAKEMNSFRDYVPGSATDGYLSTLNKFKEAVERLLDRNSKMPYPATAEQLELVQYYSDKYSEKLAEAINQYNSIEARCPSILITGGGNFPVRKKQKQNDARDKFREKYSELFEPENNYYFTKIQNLLFNTTIYSNDALVLEKLNNKLADLENLQQEMKKKNAYYRKNKTMKGYEGLSDEDAESLDNEIKKSYSWEQCPCPFYYLKNNNAEIRRIKARIAEIERLKKEAKNPNTEKYQHVDGVEVVENSEAMRIQLMFDGKPDEETRNILKSNGFRWSPSFKAWQRQLNSNGMYATKRVLKELADRS